MSLAALPFSQRLFICRTHLTAIVVVLTSFAIVAADHPDPLPIDNANAANEQEMKPYAEKIEHSRTKIDMVPIPGGKFVMGSPETEEDRNDDEGPQREIEIAPFWMSTCEITWNAYEIWMFDLDIRQRDALGIEPNQRDALADEFQLSQPTKPYTDMTFGMGKRDFPAISMTQHAARTFCKWLSQKTGRYYRLPTEAEWEYACRAGTTTAYSFGDDPEQLGDYAWYYENSDEKYHKVGQKKPNPWGLYDMHGNVAEWVLDQYQEEYEDGAAQNPLRIPTTLYPRVARGGSWDDDADRLRSAARLASESDWKGQDPQIPQSIWYHTDAQFLGFRIIRPLHEPSDAEKAEKWEKSDPPQIDID